MRSSRSPSSPDLRNHVIRRIVDNAKTHPESREFRPDGRGGARFEDALVFTDDKLNEELAVYPLEWHVCQRNTGNPRSLSSSLLAKVLGRIRGLDANAPHATFRYQQETGSPAFWHENQIGYDQDGVVSNDHVPLPEWPESFRGPNSFARRVAARWNIGTWRDGEEPSLFNLDEVAP
jgi:hypothetical protein